MAELPMPKFGLTMTEGQILEWQKKPGERFVKGEILFVVETEKVANEVEAEADGELLEVLVAEGETIAVGLAIARVAYAGDAGQARAEAAGAAPQAGDQPSAAAALPAQAHVAAFDAPSARKRMHEQGLSRAQVQGSGRDGRILKGDVLRIVATPLARRAAHQHGVALADLQGSGPNGRIKAVDVERSLASPAAVTTTSAVIADAGAALLKPDAARLATARRVQAAKRDIPHFYVARMAEVQALGALRERLNEDGEGRARISVTHMLVKALGLALAQMPALNRIWTDEGILALASADIGMVTQTPQGLRIPMFRDAGAESLDGIARIGADLATRARAGQLVPKDVGGGAISISNVGMFGALSLTPIISPPQAMILGVGAEQQLFRPNADGQPTLRREICLTLAADHRIIDGADAAGFLQCVSRNLEEPLRLLRAPLRANV